MRSNRVNRRLEWAAGLTILLLGSMALAQDTDHLGKAVQAAQEAGREALAKEFPRDEIVVRQEDGPYGTVIAVAAYPKAYPGTGVYRAVVDRATGVVYGRHGQRTFADFARARGWLKTPPPAEELVRFLNTALFDGIAMFDLTTGTPPAVRAAEGKLVIEVVRRWMPSMSGERLVVTVGEAGAETVERQRLKE